MKKVIKKKIIKTEAYDWRERPVSWSSISSFEYDPEQWYQKYVVHGACCASNEEKNIIAYCVVFKVNDSSECPVNVKSKEMAFGSFIGKKLETDPKFLPMIKRHSKMEHPFKCKFGKMELIGYGDSFCDLTNKKLSEFKTGKKAWDQARADAHGQIDMYLLMNFIMNKIKPEDMEEIILVWMPTQDNSDFSISFIEPIEKHIKMFYTKRTMMDILKFGERINKVRKQMEDYVKNHA